MDKVKILLEKDNVLKRLKKDSLTTLVIQRNWEAIAGKILSKQLTVEFTRGALLVLSVKNPCWYSEIDFYKETLLKKINEEFMKKEMIKWIKLMVINK